MAERDDDQDLDRDVVGLSDEEKAALEDDDDEKEIIDDIANGDDDDVGEESEETDDGGEEGAAAKEEKTAVAAEDEPPPKEGLEQFSGDKNFMPALHVEKVDGYEEKLADIQTKYNDLDNKLENGDIDLKDYTSQFRELNAKETDLKMTQRTAEDNERQNSEMNKQRWEWEQQQFFDNKSNEVYANNGMLRAALNDKVIELAKMPENINRSGTWFLNEADKAVRGLFAASEKAEPPKKGASVTDIKDARRPNLDKIPKTLADMPAAENTETGADGEFAYLDKLTGMDLEAALADMSKDPAKEARYLRSA